MVIGTIDGIGTNRGGITYTNKISLFGDQKHICLVTHIGAYQYFQD